MLPTPESCMLSGAAFHSDDFVFSLNNFDINRPVGEVVKDTTTGAGCFGFDYRVNQIRHSVSNSSPSLQWFFGAVLPRR